MHIVTIRVGFRNGNLFYHRYNGRGDATFVPQNGDGASGWRSYGAWGDINYASDDRGYYNWNAAWGYMRFPDRFNFNLHDVLGVGLYYAHGRWYNQDTGLWLSPNENGEYLYGSGQDTVNYSWLLAASIFCMENNPNLDSLLRGPNNLDPDFLNRVRRLYASPIFGCKNVFTNLPFIAFYANQYQIDPAALAAVIYYESDAAERIFTNFSINPYYGTLTDLDLWQFARVGTSSIGVGQINTNTAIRLEESGLIPVLTPNAPLVSREAIVALRLRLDFENIRYAAAQLAFVQQAIVENAAGLNLSQQDKARLLLTGYNVGRDEIQRAMIEAGNGNFAALRDYLMWDYGTRDVWPIYLYFKGGYP